VIVLDTTVLVYAKGAEHAYRESCRNLIEAIADGALEATTTAEVIQEFVHVRARRRDRSDAAKLGSDYADLLSPLIPVDGEALRHGLDLYLQHEALGAFDAVLAATAITVAAVAIVSADSAFAGIPRLKHVIPDLPGISALVQPG
jgi:predicted nucleic acid-binding protein